jgi:hypothetical protein
MRIASRLTVSLAFAVTSAVFPSVAQQNTAPPRPTDQVPALSMDDTSEGNVKNLAPHAMTYMDLSVEQLVSKIPELIGLQPSKDQTQLPLILKNTGHNVDAFAHNVGDLIADEDLTQQKLNPDGKIRAKLHTQDDYLILQHGSEWGANSEYRMDKHGNPLESTGLQKGYLVTAGYALNCITFSSGAQSQSDFRYLGDQKIETRGAFVIVFAQRPEDATFKTLMRNDGIDVEVLTQGILWIDKDSFQILRMRTDLLNPSAKLRLRTIATNVDFSAVKLRDNPDPLWLPNDVTVFIEINGGKYRNFHHYSNYRRYQVAVKIGNS